MPTNSPQPGGPPPPPSRLFRFLALLRWFLPTRPSFFGFFVIFIFPFLLYCILFCVGTGLLLFPVWLFVVLTARSVFSPESPPEDGKKQRSPKPLLLPQSLTPAPKDQNIFHLFPRLPTELRLEIWSYVCFPRFVQLQPPGRGAPRRSAIRYWFELFCWHYRLRLNPDMPYDGPTRVLVSRTPPPALLAVNSEARQVALKRYVLAFATTTDLRPRVYVDFERDLVSLPYEILNRPSGRWFLKDTPDLARINWLCVPKPPLAWLGARPRDCLRSLGMGWVRVFAGVEAVCVLKPVTSPKSPPHRLSLASWWPSSKGGQAFWWYYEEEGREWIKTDPWGLAKVANEIYKQMD